MTNRLTVTNPQSHSSHHEHLMACPSCDWLHLKEKVEPHQKAKCARCGEVLYTFKPETVDVGLAAILTSLILLLASLFLPFLKLSRSGIDSGISLLDAAWSLVFSDIALLGVFVLLLIVLIPLLRMLLLLYVLVVVKSGGQANTSVKLSLRLAFYLEPWAMADVFLIGVVVSLIKINELAVLDIGPAFWAWIGLIISTILVSITLSRDTLWQQIQQS